MQNLHLIGIFIHTFVCSIPLTLHISDLRLECQIEDMHTRSYFARIHVRLQKRKFFHILGKGHKAYSHSLVTKGSDTDIFLQMSFLVPATFWDFASSPKYLRFWNFDVRKVFEIFYRHTVNSLFIN